METTGTAHTARTISAAAAEASGQAGGHADSRAPGVSSKENGVCTGGKSCSGTNGHRVLFAEISCAQRRPPLNDLCA